MFTLLSLFLACKPAPLPSPVEPNEPTPVPTSMQDNDSDGYTASIDCDDTNATINPGALEICNGIDDNCSGQIDDNPIDGVTAYADADLDGYGEESTGVALCGVIPAGFVGIGGDCNDDNAEINPGASEACDDIDADCDGTPGFLDDDAPGELNYYLDADNDGFGAGTSIAACAPPTGYVTQSGDCDDTIASTYPGAAEQCDGTDNDCNGIPDDDLTGTWFYDGDGDGYGVPGNTVEDCLAPVDYVASSDDCDDANAAVYPGNAEICDTYDNDCDSFVDDEDPEGAVDALTYYPDADLDGYGTGDGTTSCDQPPDTVTQGGDCDDARDNVYPGALEICDTYDNDCDTFADDEDPEGVHDGARFYVDADLDGFGDPDNYVDACLPPPDLVANGDDCDDTRDDVYPGVPELCNGGIDDNCDGVIDEDDPLAILGTWYVDHDGDGYGNPDLPTLVQCEQPPDYAAQANDCDDTRDTIYLGAPELCDTYDNDCDDLIDDDDDDVADGGLYYYDADLDGYGYEPGFYACVEPLDVITTGGDCDDDRDDVYEGAPEICDTYDNDCDGLIDDTDPDVEGIVSAYVDADLDGFGFGDSVLVCEIGPGFVENADDCDDTRDTVYPAAPEICDTYDNDCDGDIDDEDPDVEGNLSAYLDDDGDGYGLDPSVLVCAVVPPYADQGGDCNDASPLVNPGAFDWANGEDTDCNGVPDSDAGLEHYDASDVQAIWDASCGGCHLSGTAGGLSLVDGYESTVEEYSVDVPTMYLVTPGDPSNSYIWAALINQRSAFGGAGGIMPPSGSLSIDDLNVVETWILEGAPETIAP